METFSGKLWCRPHCCTVCFLAVGLQAKEMLVISATALTPQVSKIQARNRIYKMGKQNWESVATGIVHWTSYWTPNHMELLTQDRLPMWVGLLINQALAVWKGEESPLYPPNEDIKRKKKTPTTILLFTSKNKNYTEHFYSQKGRNFVLKKVQWNLLTLFWKHMQELICIPFCYTFRRDIKQCSFTEYAV